ncbi:MAG: circularly permuted type 2 ATP-grasp protein, partial [Acinetobacter sp.]
MLKENDRTHLISTVEHFPGTLGADIHISTADKAKNHSKINGLFQQLKSHFFNELVDDQTISGETCSKIEHWLSQHSIEELKSLNQAAKDHFLYEGITFTVYEDAAGTERTIPYDLIPRVIEKKQWNKVALGCAQRVRALNLFLHDIYHQQDILKANIVPELQVLMHEAYQPHMYAHDLKGKIYSQISGID